MIFFSIPLTPMVKQRPRFVNHNGRRFVYTDKKTVDFEKSFKELSMPYCVNINRVRVNHICIHFFKVRPKSLSKKILAWRTRPDLDNLAKAVLDSLQGIAFDDDGQLDSIVLKKSFDTYDHVDITLEYML